MAKKTIVIGISSGIAAYKILDLIKLYKKQDHNVVAMMTKKASFMLSPSKVEKLTGNITYIHLFDDAFSYKQVLRKRKVDHIEVAKKADIFVIAPATANTIAKLAHGIADSFLTTSVLATQAPILICPSMNDVMWHHPATQKNLNLLASYGYQLLTPGVGNLACGTYGIGRLPEIDMIAKTTNQLLKQSALLLGKKVLITSGGTSEPIDDARVITNRSSGKMGLALAQMAYQYGADVTLVHAQNSATSHLPIRQKPYTSVTELLSLLETELLKTDIVIHAAAVSDFTVDRAGEKLDSTISHTITLSPTKKIINEIKNINPNVVLIGFKAISQIGGLDLQIGGFDLESKTIKKVQKLFTDAKADYVVVNDISRDDIGFGADENEVMIYSKKGKVKKIPKTSKQQVARQILTYIVTVGR